MERKLKKFKQDDTHNLEKMVESRDPEIVYPITESIFYGIDNNLMAVDCFEIEKDDCITTYKMARGEWKASLNRLLIDMIDYEDYESCSKIQNYLIRLNMKYIESKKDI